VRQEQSFAKSIDNDPKKLSRLPGNLHHFEQKVVSLREYLGLLETDPASGWYATLQTVFSQSAELRAELGRLPYFNPLVQAIALHRPLLWIGPEGQVSPLHLDKLPNFIVQLYGSKRWKLYPAAEMDRVYLPSQLPSAQFSGLDADQPDLTRFPKFATAREHRADLGPGDVLYVPPEWPHHVRALDLSISVNLWWAGHNDARRVARSVFRRLTMMVNGRDAGYGG